MVARGMKNIGNFMQFDSGANCVDKIASHTITVTTLIHKKASGLLGFTSIPIITNQHLFQIA